MPNELVPTQTASVAPRQEILTPPDHSHGGEDIVRWDLTPEELYRIPTQEPTGPEHSIQGAKKAEKDAAAARKIGDTGFAVTREEDSREHMQTRWDWGDLRTWLILAALVALGLVLALGSYNMPHGRDAAQAAIRVY